MKKDLRLRFNDYAKAFDKVQHEELFSILNRLDIDDKDLHIIRNRYWDQTAATQLDGEISQSKPVKGGVRQGYVLSRDLFNIYSELILRNIKDLDGIGIGGVNINNPRYADDTVLIAQSERRLRDIVDKITEESMKRGLDLNIETECMIITKKSEIPIFHLKSKGEDIKQVNAFKYLGYTLTANAWSRIFLPLHLGLLA